MGYEVGFVSQGSNKTEPISAPDHDGGICRIQPTLSSRTKDCPNRNNYPNPYVCKQDLNSSLAAVC